MFWNNTTQPLLKDRFLVILDGDLQLEVKSVDKPTLSFENKEYKMMNHYFKYPGLPKWNTIKIVFISMDHNPTAQFLVEKVLSAAGYETPGEGRRSVSKKDSLKALGDVKIQQISYDRNDSKKNTVVEEWKLINPIIKTVNFGSLAYGEDGLVEYELELDYDYAEFSSGHNMLGSS